MYTNYYIYKITVNDKIYIGCTNNLRRRLNQHNSNAKKRNSKLGVYLDDNHIILSSKDMTILHECNDRKIAFRIERRVTKEYEQRGFEILNDNYSVNCTRKGKTIGCSSKEYYLINYLNHTSTYVNNLRQYCISNDLNYKNIQHTIRGNKVCNDGYKVFEKEQWESIGNKDYFLSGEFIQDNQNNTINNLITRCSKQYKVRFPDGHIETIVNLDNFAREHNLTSGTLHATLSKNKPTKGYQVLERL